MPPSIRKAARSKRPYVEEPAARAADRSRNANLIDVTDLLRDGPFTFAAHLAKLVPLGGETDFMRLSWEEIARRAKAFSEEWKDAHYEKGETQSFYNDFFEIFGIRRRQVAIYEKQVQSIAQNQVRGRAPAGQIAALRRWLPLAAQALTSARRQFALSYSPQTMTHRSRLFPTAGSPFPRAPRAFPPSRASVTFVTFRDRLGAHFDPRFP